MLQIIYADSNQPLAEQLRSSFAETELKLQHDCTIVLLSEDALHDKNVQQAAEDAKAKQNKMVVVSTDTAEAPDWLSGIPSVDFQDEYRFDALLAEVKTQDRSGRRKSIWLLVAAVVVVMLMFALSIYGIINDQFAFPSDEAATEGAILDATRDFFIEPTLTYFQPHTTQDAENIELTLEAVPTIIRPFAVITATVVAIEAQNEATLTAEASNLVTPEADGE